MNEEGLRQIVPAAALEAGVASDEGGEAGDGKAPLVLGRHFGYPHPDSLSDHPQQHAHYKSAGFVEPCRIAGSHFGGKGETGGARGGGGGDRARRELEAALERRQAVTAGDLGSVSQRIAAFSNPATPPAAAAPSAPSTPAPAAGGDGTPSFSQGRKVGSGGWGGVRAAHERQHVLVCAWCRSSDSSGAWLTPATAV